MNKRQKIVIMVAMALMLLCGMFPERYGVRFCLYNLHLGIVYGDDLFTEWFAIALFAVGAMLVFGEKRSK
jgi:hypothetical protein